MQDIETFFDFPVESIESSPPETTECYEEYTLDGKKWIRCTFPDCGKTFRYKSEISRHQVIHFNSRPYPCPFSGCRKSFKRPDGLETHVRTHTKDMPFQCTVPECGQKFTTRASLRYHLLKHNDQPTFKCSFEGCDKSFLTQAQLKQHEKSSNYHKKICATKPAPVVEVMELPLPAKKAAKDGNSFYKDFFETAPRKPEEIQFQMMDLAEEDEYVEPEQEEELPQNFENIVKYIVDENKILKQNVELRNKLMSALQENYELKAQMNKLETKVGLYPQQEKMMASKAEEPSFFFSQNDFDMFEFLREGDNTNF